MDISLSQIRRVLPGGTPASKYFFKCGLPIVKDFNQLSAYYHIVHDLSKKSKPQSIVNLIQRLNSVYLLDKPMLVVPKAVWPEAHFIYKENGGLDVGNFGNPGRWHTKNGFQVKLDDHTGVHFLRNRVGYFEIEPGRGDLLEIIGIGKKIPGGFNGYGQELAAF